MAARGVEKESRGREIADCANLRNKRSFEVASMAQPAFELWKRGAFCRHGRETKQVVPPSTNELSFAASGTRAAQLVGFSESITSTSLLPRSSRGTS